MGFWLAMQAWWEFLYLDVVGLRGFEAVHRLVAATRTRPVYAAPEAVGTVLDAVATAHMLYVKPARCLQHAAVVTRLMRRRGIPADMVIGYQLPPLKAHAWVEVAGEIVGIEHQDEIEHYSVLDRWRS